MNVFTKGALFCCYGSFWMDHAHMDKNIKFGKISDQILWNTLYNINILLDCTCLPFWISKWPPLKTCFLNSFNTKRDRKFVWVTILTFWSIGISSVLIFKMATNSSLFISQYCANIIGHIFLWELHAIPCMTYLASGR